MVSQWFWRWWLSFQALATAQHDDEHNNRCIRVMDSTYSTKFGEIRLHSNPVLVRRRLPTQHWNIHNRSKVTLRTRRTSSGREQRILSPNSRDRSLFSSNRALMNLRKAPYLRRIEIRTVIDRWGRGETVSQHECWGECCLQSEPANERTFLDGTPSPQDHHSQSPFTLVSWDIIVNPQMDGMVQYYTHRNSQSFRLGA